MNFILVIGYFIVLLVSSSFNKSSDTYLPVYSSTFSNHHGGFFLESGIHRPSRNQPIRRLLPGY